MMKLTTST
jgi:hypothetical protein